MAEEAQAEVPTRTLVEGLVRADGTVDAGELYEVAGALGMSDQQVRLCIKRMAAEGLLVQEGRGRRAVLRETEQARRAADPEVEFVRHMYAQDAGLAPWDGGWHLAAFAVPESARHARDALRETLVRLGGAAVQGGLYACANAWEPYVEAEAERLGVRDRLTLLTSTDLRIGGESEPLALARRLWPLEELADGHRRLAAVARSRLARLTAAAPPGRTERLAATVELAAEFTRATAPDPLLPPELLPRPWPGAEARALTAECWRLLLRAEHADPAPGPRLFHRYDEAVRRITGVGQEN
ncbi:transcriptional regulator [Kitasatospora sp. RG8]|uniref:PaaX family transcriptional regulator C-terminal domain-containing protein n=1 Tax=Kitasatospora sp. RG8 TaxID=2820815 RepID=UPI001ADFB883|nr:PaaX family transcriptional regulator C-terminal domain-containing protein [Kitasatospora sp. RG8]MBP0451584.1 transcriptional regulator [Kitasatospora sp. RG8]